MPTPTNPNPSFGLSKHAAHVVAERGITMAWIEAVFTNPSRTESDPADPELIHAIARVPEFGGRVLRVVYNPTVTPPRIVTVFFDRRLRNRL